MAIRYGDRSRVSTNPGQWLNPRQPLGLSYTNPRQVNANVVTVTASTSAHTYGAWTQIISSTAADTSVLFINCGGVSTSTVNTASVLSIGIGSSGNEVELFFFAVGAYSSLGGSINNSSVAVVVPVTLPAGTRIAARLQSIVTGGKTATVTIATFDADPANFVNGPKQHESLGVNLSLSEGTSIAANNAYTEIVASTNTSYRGVTVCGSAASNDMAGITGTMTVAVGPAGSEIDFGTLNFWTGGTEFYISLANNYFPRYIPSGSRISIKQSSVNTQIDASIIGVV